jgi:hypothetical protein
MCPCDSNNGVNKSGSDAKATVARKSPLLRDLLFPIYSVEQLLWVLFFCVVTYFVSLAVGDWRYVFAGYAGGSLALTSIAPARLKAPASALQFLYETLEKMHFIKDADSTRYRYRRWLAFRNSYLDVRCNGEMVEVDGPMSTLKVIASVLNRRRRS